METVPTAKCYQTALIRIPIALLSTLSLSKYQAESGELPIDKQQVFDKYDEKANPFIEFATTMISRILLYKTAWCQEDTIETHLLYLDLNVGFFPKIP